jgi:hypothetical protein
MQAPQVDVTQILNQYINCIDIGKDAAISWQAVDADGNPVVQRLTEADHGEYIKNSLIQPLFSGAMMGDDWVNIVVGVGDRKAQLRQQVEDRLGILNQRPRQELPKLKFSANNQDSRLRGIAYSQNLDRNLPFNLAYDSGTGADGIFREYTLVLTPGSLLDPGSRAKAHNPNRDFLNEQSIINNERLTQLALDQVSINNNGVHLNTIAYDPQANGNRIVRFNYQVGQPENFRFDENWNFIPGGGQENYFGGNRVKNRFILDHWINNESDIILGHNRRFILAKELGDTLQVGWLKLFIDVEQQLAEQEVQPQQQQQQQQQVQELNRLTIGNTALITCDSVVWLRCIVNNVGCIYKEGNVITYYKPNFGDNLAIFLGLEKNRLLAKYDENNARIIQTFEEIRDNIDNDALRIFGEVVPQNSRNIIANICNFLVQRLTQRSEENRGLMNVAIQDNDEMENFRQSVARYMFKSPFTKAHNRYSHVSSFRRFYEPIQGARRCAFDPMLFYKIMRTNVSNTLIRSYLKDFLNPQELDVFNFGALHGGKRNSARKTRRNKQKRFKATRKERKFWIGIGGQPRGERIYVTDELDMNTLFLSNLHQVGFYAYFILNYYPEVLYIGYAGFRTILEYNLPRNGDVPDENLVQNLFSYETGQILNLCFSKPDSRAQPLLTVTNPGLIGIDINEWLQIADNITAMLVTIADVMIHSRQLFPFVDNSTWIALNGGELVNGQWINHHDIRPPDAVYNQYINLFQFNNQVNLGGFGILHNVNSHGYRVMDIYQEIYEKELRYCVTNTRNQMNPTENIAIPGTLQQQKINALEELRIRRRNYYRSVGRVFVERVNEIQQIAFNNKGQMLMNNPGMVQNLAFLFNIHDLQQLQLFIETRPQDQVQRLEAFFKIYARGIELHENNQNLQRIFQVYEDPENPPDGNNDGMFDYIKNEFAGLNDQQVLHNMEEDPAAHVAMNVNEDPNQGGYIRRKKRLTKKRKSFKNKSKKYSKIK